MNIDDYPFISESWDGPTGIVVLEGHILNEASAHGYRQRVRELKAAGFTRQADSLSSEHNTPAPASPHPHPQSIEENT